MMVEKRQRSIGRERREPKGETGKLHRHRIHVDAIQATLSHYTSNCHPFPFTEVAGMATATTKERLLVGVCKVATGGDEESAAAHRRIDDSKLQNSVWF